MSAVSAENSAAMQAPSTDFGPNEWLVDELYQRYQADPGSVDRAWWNFFADYHPEPPEPLRAATAAPPAPASPPPAAAPAPAAPASASPASAPPGQARPGSPVPSGPARGPASSGG